MDGYRKVTVSTIIGKTLFENSKAYMVFGDAASGEAVRQSSIISAVVGLYSSLLEDGESVARLAIRVSED